MSNADPGYNPASEAFKNFDQGHPNSLLGSLHLDSEEEPRRGASRANSVRFDESALHGHFGHGSRSSTDFLPLRTGSAFGSHPMTERSSSHKSDGRQSSAGQSNQSARAGSFAFESRPLSAAVAPFVPLGPPPGLFILGPVPSIIRCWLDTNFSNESLLYAAVCTGSYKSVIDFQLANQLGVDDQITTDRAGQRTLKIPVYLPEATIQQSSSRSNSPVPQLPTLTIDFTVQDLPGTADTIQIFLGSDVLRARNADIHFSLDRLTLFDDDRNKLSVPLVRPEKASLFKHLLTTNLTDSPTSASLADQTGQSEKSRTGDEGAKEGKLKLITHEEAEFRNEAKAEQPSATISRPLTSSPSVIGDGRKLTAIRTTDVNSPVAKVEADTRDAGSFTNGTTPDTPSKVDGGSIWGSWRRDATLPGRTEPTSSSSITTSGYQRAGRGRGMKVLKPARLNTSTSRSASAAQPPVGFDAAPSRFGESTKGTGQAMSAENQDSRSPVLEGKPFPSDTKQPLQSLTNRSRPSNPIGGASAFGWLNSGQQKQSPTASD